MPIRTCTTRCTDGPRIVPVPASAKSGTARRKAKRATRAIYWWTLLANGAIQ
jgi:hypothetical protein